MSDHESLVHGAQSQSSGTGGIGRQRRRNRKRNRNRDRRGKPELALASVAGVANAGGASTTASATTSNFYNAKEAVRYTKVRVREYDQVVLSCTRVCNAEERTAIASSFVCIYVCLSVCITIRYAIVNGNGTFGTFGTCAFMQ